MGLIWTKTHQNSPAHLPAFLLSTHPDRIMLLLPPPISPASSSSGGSRAAARARARHGGERPAGVEQQHVHGMEGSGRREQQPRTEGDRQPKESREGGGSEQRREEQGRAGRRAYLLLRGAEGSGPAGATTLRGGERQPGAEGYRWRCSSRLGVRLPP